jgi:hypothetical protein
MCKRSLCCNVSADTGPVVVQRSDHHHQHESFGSMETPTLGGSTLRRYQAQTNCHYWKVLKDYHTGARTSNVRQLVVIALQTALWREYNKSQR